MPKLIQAFPGVDFGQLASEEDELWTEERESKRGLAERGLCFLDWLCAQSDEEVAVVCHSSFLLTLFNVVLRCEDPELERWFGTGELRSVWVTWANPWD